jgi:hypothetical protein
VEGGILLKETALYKKQAGTFLQCYNKDSRNVLSYQTGTYTLKVCIFLKTSLLFQVTAMQFDFVSFTRFETYCISRHVLHWPHLP